MIHVNRNEDTNKVYCPRCKSVYDKKENLKFCTSCMNSEFMTVHNLINIILQPFDGESIAPKDSIMKEANAAFELAKSGIIQKKNDRVLKRLESELDEIQKRYNVAKKLANEGVDIQERLRSL